MADDMYDDAAPSEAESAANGTNESGDDKSDATEDQLALVPSHFFKDTPKPGNREMVEIVEVYEGEVSIKCVYGEEEKKEEAPPDDESAPTEAEDPSMM